MPLRLLSALVAGCLGNSQYTEPRKSCDEPTCEHQAACEDCVAACPADCFFYDLPGETGQGSYRCENKEGSFLSPGQYSEERPSSK